MQTNGTAKGAPILCILDVVRRRKLYIIVPTLLLTAGVIAFMSRLHDRYRAEALLAVEPAPTAQYLKDAAPVDKPNIQDQLRLIHETLLDRALLEQVIKQFKLDRQVGRGDLDRVVEDVKGRIRIQVEGTDAFHIGFEGGDRQEVTDVANRLAELFITNTSQVRERTAEQAAGLVDEELERLKNKLAAQDERIRQYKQEVGQELPELLATNMKLLETLETRLQAKTDLIAEAQARSVAIEAEMKGLQKQDLQTNKEPGSEQSPSEKRLEELKLKLKEAEAKYMPLYPEIPRLKKEISDLEQSIAIAPPKSQVDTPTGSMRNLALKAEQEGIKKRLENYKREERELHNQIAALQQRIGSSPKHERVLAEMMREQESTRTQYQTLLDKQHEVKLAGRLQKSGQGMIFKIVEPASVPQAPYSPQRARLILLGFIASLGLGVVLAFFMEYVDTAFETLDEFKSFTNLPVLAAIPPVPSRPETRRRPAAKGRTHLSAVPPDSVVTGSQLLQPNMRHLQKSRIVTLTDPGAIASEQYSILAIKLRWHLGEGSSKVLSLTSASGGEGKTLTAVNMSIALTESGAGKVLLIDADLRKPRVHDYLGIEPGNGLSNLLQDPEGDIHREIRKMRDLYVLPGGSNFSNPVAVLGSDKMRQLIERLRLEFQYIVLDSPPILPIADSQVLAGYADGVLLVVRARRTRRELFQHAVESFRAPNIVGVVLNDVNHRNSRYYRAYEYYKQNYYKRRYLTGT